MRIAVFADVHGNPYACRAVLDAIRQHEPLDGLVVAGDICLGGSDPGGVVDMLREAGADGVYGNTETYLYDPYRPPGDEAHLKKWDEVQATALWTLDRLSSEQLKWLRSLPFEQRYSPTVRPADDLLVVHANPRDIELMVYPPAEQQEELWGYVRQPDDDPELASALRDVTARAVAFGHFHYTFVRPWRDLILVDTGPCSLPGYDGDLRARYSLLDWNGSDWQIEQFFVPYDYNQEAAALRKSDMPYRQSSLDYFE